MNMPPVNPKNSSQPLQVTFHLDINSFENMVMADMELGVMMRMNLQWEDNRLQYNNIREDQFQVTCETTHQSASRMMLLLKNRLPCGCPLSVSTQQRQGRF